MTKLHPALLLVVLAVPAAAQPRQGDPVEGRRLAETWCANCHAFSTSGRAGDAVPSFAAIAARPGTTEEGISAFLRTPHPVMPDHNLTLQEARNLAAFLLTHR
ncbi:MAG TPA: c-type cytochrome [Acetobacteraceae bacterium]|jgi:mono/diheme cytochrome c family protein|nr:c-type cytochrome [Acetobacteraceae bacterium]